MTIPSGRSTASLWWRQRCTWRRSRNLGAFGAAGALMFGACSPTQCAPIVPPPPAEAPAPVPAPGAVSLEARPVQGPCTYRDTYGAPRSGGRVHLGTDIAAAEGNELYAVATGEISKIYTEAEDSLAGNGLRIRRPDGTVFFYAHLSALAPGITLGTSVTAGQVVGYVGQTGNAGGPHLHLEIHPFGGEPVNPFPIVQAIGAC